MGSEMYPPRLPWKKHSTSQARHSVHFPFCASSGVTFRTGRPSASALRICGTHSVMHTLFELSRPLIEIRPAFFGLSMILVLIFLPGGLESLASRILARRQRRPEITTAKAQ